MSVGIWSEWRVACEACGRVNALGPQSDSWDAGEAARRRGWVNPWTKGGCDLDRWQCPCCSNAKRGGATSKETQRSNEI